MEKHMENEMEATTQGLGTIFSESLWTQLP